VEACRTSARSAVTTVRGLALTTTDKSLAVRSPAPAVRLMHFYGAQVPACSIWVHSAVSGCTWVSDVNRCASWAYDINSRGQVVGYSTTASDPNLRAVLWSNGTAHDLNEFRGDFDRLYLATGINDRGQIVGYGVVDDEYHAFRLDPAPVPEPRTIVLLFTCFGCIAVWNRQRLH
jgi:probable HAF family extracellular repeat protein